MNKMRPNPKIYFWLVFIMLLLTSCNLRKLYTKPVSTQGGVSPTALVATATAQPTTITTPTALPPSMTETLAQTPTSTSLPLVKVDGLRVAYIIEGNLYVQDSGGEPVQLTTSGEDRMPKFSDDGEKIIFFRGPLEAQYRVYVINADGTNEQPLITSEILMALGLGYDESTEIDSYHLLHNSHKLLFSTQQFEANSDDGLSYSNHPNAKGNRDLLSIDIDTAEIKRLQDRGKGGLFQISPDEKLMTDSRNIFSINGDIVRRNLITYLPEWTNEGVMIIWTQDSTKLIVVHPIKGNSDPTDGPEPRTIWQYPIDGGLAVETRLNPPPMSDFTISPDGNWIAYTYFYYEGKTDETTPSGVYIGNLRNGSSQLVELGRSYGLPSYFVWSPESKFFIFANDRETELYLGNTNGDVVSLNVSMFLGWIDNNHYICQRMGDIMMGTVADKKHKVVVNLPKNLENLYTAHFTFFYTKP